MCLQQRRLFTVKIYKLENVMFVWTGTRQTVLFSHFSSCLAGEKVFWHSEREVYSHQALMNTSTTTTRPGDWNKYVTYTSGNSAEDVLEPPEYGSPAPKWKRLNRSLKVKLPLNITSSAVKVSSLLMNTAERVKNKNRAKSRVNNQLTWKL